MSIDKIVDKVNTNLVEYLKKFESGGSMNPTSPEMLQFRLNMAKLILNQCHIRNMFSVAPAVSPVGIITQKDNEQLVYECVTRQLPTLSLESLMDLQYLHTNVYESLLYNWALDVAQGIDASVVSHIVGNINAKHPIDKTEMPGDAIYYKIIHAVNKAKHAPNWLVMSRDTFLLLRSELTKVSLIEAEYSKSYNSLVSLLSTTDEPDISFRYLGELFIDNDIKCYVINSDAMSVDCIIGTHFDEDFGTDAYGNNITKGITWCTYMLNVDHSRGVDPNTYEPSTRGVLRYGIALPALENQYCTPFNITS